MPSRRSSMAAGAVWLRLPALASFGLRYPQLRRNVLLGQVFGEGGKAHGLTGSTVMPRYRVCNADGLECALTASNVRLWRLPRPVGRHGSTVDALDAHSAPPAHSRRRQRQRKRTR